MKHPIAGINDFLKNVFDDYAMEYGQFFQE